MFTKKNFYAYIFSVFLLALISAIAQAEFIKGADISWHTEQINAGYSWKNDNGDPVPLHDILKDHSMNAIRLRVWVNPTNGWNNQADVVTKAIWAKNARMKILLNFHYSDKWADPGQQSLPELWQGANVAALNANIWDHTRSVLNALKSNGVKPAWVQIGNETSDGMLWPKGKASSKGFKNYASFVTTGTNAAKSIFPQVKTIVHLANAQDRETLQWNLDGLRASNAKYDIIGLSLYPDSNWGPAVNSYISNLNYLKNRYGKDVMLVEVGMNAGPVQVAYNALSNIIDRTKDNGGLAVFYWEPQGYDNWEGYSKHAWSSYGEPTWALDAFIYSGN